MSSKIERSQVSLKISEEGRMNIIRDPLVDLGIGLVVTIVVAIIVYKKQEKRKRIMYEIISDVSIASIDERVKNKIKLIYKDNGSEKEIKDANLVTLKLWNAGKRDIKIWNTADIDIQDMEVPITFQFEGRTVTSLTELKSDPPNNLIGDKNLETYLKKPFPEPDSVSMPRCFLSPKQSISLSILLQGTKGRVIQSGKLFDGRIMMFDPNKQKKSQRRLVFLLTNVLSIFFVIIFIQFWQLLLLDTQTYTGFTDDALVGHILVLPSNVQFIYLVDFKELTRNGILTDSNFVMHGNGIHLRADIISYSPWLRIFGLHSGYKLSIISSKSTIFLNQNNEANPWISSIIGETSSLSPSIPPDGKIYDVFVTQTGLIVSPIQ